MNTKRLIEIRTKRGRLAVGASAALLGAAAVAAACSPTVAQQQAKKPAPAKAQRKAAAAVAVAEAAKLPPGTFTNPIVRSRSAADPWLVYRDGFYYFTFTAGRSVEIWKSPTITGLDEAKKVTVWRAPEKGPNSQHVWAPEIHFVRGKWYVYYTATPGPDADRRQFVLEATSDDPQGSYIDRGQIVVPQEDEYAIDGSVFETPKGQLYFIWSGRKVSKTGPQNIYIAPMSNPYTLSGPRVLLSEPTYDWEKHGWSVNEGPEVLQRNGKTFLVYSASGGTTRHYALGMLTNTDGNLLRPESWSKAPLPLFHLYEGPDGAVYTPGHNGFCKSPDGKEDWIVYHGKDDTDGTWGRRTARAQRFTWNADDSPNFGHPVPPGVPLALPSGEPGAKPLEGGKGTGLRAEYFAGRGFDSAPKVTRLEPGVHRDWGLAAPAPGLPVDGFSVRWTGQVEPRFTETYTFQTYADDGIRVWVDGNLLIDDWEEHAPTAKQGKIDLVAGRRYDIRVEYFENVRGARAQLAWVSPSQPYEPIPASRLYPAGERGR